MASEDLLVCPFSRDILIAAELSDEKKNGLDAAQLAVLEVPIGIDQIARDPDRMWLLRLLLLLAGGGSGILLCLGGRTQQAR